jgi:transcriptional regulator GlxA family with amidase domain
VASAELLGRWGVANIQAGTSSSTQAMPVELAHSDALVKRFESWARSRLTQGFSLDDAAAAAGSSKRTLARRMQAVLGKSPLSYFQE